MEMMNPKHSLARKLNPNGLSPLRLALEKDQTRLALELVKVDPSLVRLRGREGLKQAAQCGSIDALYDLIDEDPYVLDKIESIPFIDTPLHIAVANGRIAFAMETMNLKPSFARKLNTSGFSPLHTALEIDQTRLALELVKFDPSLVRVRGRQGMTPLHLVVRKGDAELLSEFVLACPESIGDVNAKGETVLHTAVMNDRYEELKVLIGWVQRMSQKDSSLLEIQVLNRRDIHGNTALHLAAYKDKQQEVRLLLGCSSVNPNLQNEMGLTALDIQQTRRHHANSHIEKIIKKSGGENSASLPKVKTASEFLISEITFLEYWSINMARYRNHISKGTRNALLVIATLIITATYQTALQPPGGVRQENNGGSNTDTTAGTAVMGTNYFRALWVCNGMAFWTAMFTTFLVLPVGREYVLWFLSILLPLYFSYAVSWCVISPGSLPYIFVIVTLLVYILSYYIVLFIAWKRSKAKKTTEPRSELVLEGITTISLARGMEDG